MPEILFEDNHCIAVDKPSGIPSAHADGGRESIDLVVKQYIKDRYEKPGNVFLGIVHRLDKPTSGVLLFARTSKAAARLAEQFRLGSAEKVYWAVVDGVPGKPAGTLDDWMKKRGTEHGVDVVAEDVPGAKRARVHYEVRASHGGLSWLELRPQTGRTHQLRVQLSSRGWPIVGDFTYGSEQTFRGGIALHAHSLMVLHPIKKEAMNLEAELPATWRGRFALLLRDLAK